MKPLPLNERIARAQELYTLGVRVWVPDDEGEVWQEATVVDVNENVLTAQDERSTAHAYAFAKVDSLPPLRNPDILECANDLTTLSYLHEPAVLHNLRERYSQMQIYTYCGIILVAINPYQQLHIYEPDLMNAYSGKTLGELDPHIFAVAESAFRNMTLRDENQSIIVSGESGAGKTESAKHAMRFFAHVGGASASGSSDTSSCNSALPTTPTSPPTAFQRNASVSSMDVSSQFASNSVEKKVLASNPIMESFGNAKTIRNDNSSRFGKYMEIQFNSQRHIVGATMRTYLLERSRVVFQAANERNYHIFYQLCAAAHARSSTDLLSLALTDHIHGPQESSSALGSTVFAYTAQGGSPCVDGVDDAKMFEVTRKSMSYVGIGSKDQHNIFRMLSAILHLGAIEITCSSRRDDKAIILDDDAHLNIVGTLLEIDAVEMAQWLRTRKIQAVRETVVIANRQQEAESSRNALAKHMYATLFAWLVQHINNALSHPELQKSFIGVLDIYGFETFQINSFEQFCINYANEKLQQQFNSHVFKLEQEEYVREEIEWVFIEFYDNQPCIDLIEDKLGIIALLDEECRMPNGSDETFVEKLSKQLKDREHYVKPRIRASEGFIIKHYATDVCYSALGFLSKNRDTVNEQQLLTLAASSNALVAALFADDSNSDAAAASAAALAAPVTSTSMSAKNRRALFGGGGMSQKGKSHKTTVGGQFKQSLSSLMTTLNATTPHYVRCIKPNEAKEPFLFTTENCIQQLRACGVLETVRISAAGYPGRWVYREFYDRYNVLLTHHGKKRWDRSNRKKSSELVCTERIKNPDNYCLGKTKIFFRAGQVAYLEKLRSDTFYRACLMMQKTVRGWLARRHYVRLRRAAIVVQTRLRSKHARALVLQMRQTRAAVRIQACWRGFRLARRFRAICAATLVLQSATRALFARRHTQQLRESRAARCIQRVYRGHRVRRTVRARIRVIVYCQSLIRRKLARRELVRLRTEARSVDRLRETAWGLENKLIEYRTRMDGYVAELAEVRATLAMTESTVSVANARAEDAEKRLGEAVSANTSQDQLIGELRARVAELEGEIEQLRREMGAADEERREMVIEVRTAQEDLAVAATTESTLRVRVDELEQRTAQLERELQVSQASHADLEAALEERQRRLIAVNLEVDIKEEEEEEELEREEEEESVAKGILQGDVNGVNGDQHQDGPGEGKVEEEKEEEEEEEGDELERMKPAKLRARAKQLQEDNATLRTENERLVARMEQLKKEMETERARAVAPEGALDARMNDEITRLTQENMVLREKIDDLMGNDDEHDVPAMAFGASAAGGGEGAVAGEARDDGRTRREADAPSTLARSTSIFRGMFRFHERDESRIVNELILNLKPAVVFDEQPGIAAHLLFMCIRFVDFKNNSKQMTHLLTSAITSFRHVAGLYKTDRNMSAFVLSNAMKLLTDMKQFGCATATRGSLLKSFDLTQYHGVLCEIVVQIFRSYIKTIEDDLNNMLVSAMLEYESIDLAEWTGQATPTRSRLSGRQMAPPDVTALLSRSVETLQRYQVDSEIVDQVVEQVFMTIGAIMLNNLLLRKGLCKWSKGMTIIHNLKVIESWARDNNFPHVMMVRPVVALRQCAQLLQIPKKEDQIDTILETCSEMSIVQMQKILTMYTPDSIEGRVPQKLIRAIAARGSVRSTDNKLMIEMVTEKPLNVPFTPLPTQFTTLEIPRAIALHDVLEMM